MGPGGKQSVCYGIKVSPGGEQWHRSLLDWTIRAPDLCEYRTDLTSRLMCSASTGRMQTLDGPH